jgi:hypothetical protein
MEQVGHHITGGQAFRVVAADRLLRFGIGRDAYEAHMMLSRLGLVTVTQDPGRHLDGKVKDFGSGGQALPHTLGFVPAGFERDAFTTLSADRLPARPLSPVTGPHWTLTHPPATARACPARVPPRTCSRCKNAWSRRGEQTRRSENATTSPAS